MTALQPTASPAITPTDPLPTSTEEGWFRRYNERQQDTAVGRLTLTEARMVADSDDAVWGSAA